MMQEWSNTSFMTRDELEAGRFLVEKATLDGSLDNEGTLIVLVGAVWMELKYMNDSRDSESQDYKESRGGFVTEVKVGGTD